MGGHSMAFKLERPKTNNTPYVLIDEEKGYMRLEGESFLEDIVTFFKDINNWLTQYLPTPFKTFTFDCAMDYFNSSTTKQLHNILRHMNKNAQNKTITVNWVVLDDNNEMLIECGEDFKEDMENLHFNIIIGVF